MPARPSACEQGISPPESVNGARQGARLQMLTAVPRMVEGEN